MRAAVAAVACRWLPAGQGAPFCLWLCLIILSLTLAVTLQDFGAVSSLADVSTSTSSEC